MATETGTDRDTGSEETVLIELDVARVGRVDRPPSRWTALVIALFTALTCLGLGASVVLPRPIEPAPSQRSEQPGDGDPWASPSGLVAGADERVPPSAIPVEAMARVAAVADGGWIVRIAGQASVTVGSLDVTLVLAGRPVAGATVVVSSEATLAAATGPTGVGAAPWSVDLALPSLGDAEIGDGVATIEISWPASPAGPAGAMVLVVSLGDSRGS
ncbi:MAG: hypothetical protein ABIZ72_09420 [Candidatus Limnocylindrales bacterium]